MRLLVIAAANDPRFLQLQPYAFGFWVQPLQVYTPALRYGQIRKEVA